MKSLKPKPNLSLIFSLLAVVVSIGHDVTAQDKPGSKGDDAKTKSSETPAAKGEAPTAKGETTASSSSDSYVNLMNQWKEKEDKLKALEAEYLAVGQARKNEIRSEYNKLLDEVKKLVSDLRKTAIEAYEEKPNQDESLVRLLIGMLTDDLHKNRLDAFFELGDILIKENCDIKHFEAIHTSKRLRAFGSEFPIDELIARYEDAKKNDLPRAVVTTSYGDIEIELFEDSAPNHVANFISLASKKRYDGSKFHRVDEELFVVQGGQPKDGKDIEYTLAGEWDHPKRRRHFKGHVGAARTPDPNSASSQFYFVTDRQTAFDVAGNSYTVFGRVISGMEFVHQIKPNDEMLSVKIIRKRDHDYVPKPYDPKAAAEAAKGKSPEKGTEESKEKGSEPKKTTPTEQPMPKGTGKGGDAGKVESGKTEAGKTGEKGPDPSTKEKKN